MVTWNIFRQGYNRAQTYRPKGGKAPGRAQGYTILSQGPETYGEMRKNYKNDDGTPIKDESALFEEYRPGLKTYINSPSAGSYRMKVSKRGVTIDFYAGDSQKPSAHFVIRGK